MKLINADNFLKQYADQVRGDTIDAIDLRLALLKEPKVDAIPIEWIREQAMKNWYKTNNSYWYIVAIRMIEEWGEKENETR